MGIQHNSASTEETKVAKDSDEKKSSAKKATSTTKLDNEANMNIWNVVKNTDPAFIKPMYTSSGNNLSSINHNYQISRATNLFGPCGLGWGYSIKNEKYIEGPVLYKEYPDAGRYIVHVIEVELWYIDPATSKRGEITHFGQTSMTYLSADNNVIFDENAPKKSLTDGIGKCLSMLGFSADIYSGQFDEMAPVYNKSEGSKSTPQVNYEDTEISKKIKASTDFIQMEDIWMGLTDEERANPANKKAKEDTKRLLSGQK